jgi:peptide chain release factor 1
MRERLEEVERSYDELTRELSAPEVASDHARLRDLGRRHSELEEIVTVGRQWRKALADAEEARSLARDEKDPETEAYFRQEAERAERQANELERQLEGLLVP